MSQAVEDRGFTVSRSRKRWPWIVGAAVVVIAAVVITFVVVRAQSASAGSPFTSTLKVHFEPAMAGEEKIIEYVNDEIAPDYGITLEAVGLQDSTQANRAVADGTYAATIHQHQWWLKQVIDANGFEETPTEELFQWAFGVYSDRYASVEEIPDGATIAIPVDGANQAQALWLLEREGLIGLDDSVEPRVAQVKDVADNPHNWIFKELDLLTLPRVLDSVDAAIGYVSQFDAGKVSRDRGILFPQAPKTFASQLVVGTKYLDDPNITALIEAFADPRLQEYLASTDDPLVAGVLTPVSDE